MLRGSLFSEPDGELECEFPRRDRMRNISRDSPIGSAIANGNWGYITQRMQDRFDCEFNEANVAESLEAERLFIASRGTKDFGAGWKDSTWMIWLKN